MEIIKRTAVVLVVVFFSLAVAGVVQELVSDNRLENEIEQQVSGNGRDYFKEAFMGECVSGDYTMQSYCACMYSEFTAKYSAKQMIALSENEEALLNAMFELYPRCEYALGSQWQ